MNELIQDKVVKFSDKIFLKNFCLIGAFLGRRLYNPLLKFKFSLKTCCWQRNSNPRLQLIFNIIKEKNYEKKKNFN